MIGGGQNCEHDVSVASAASVRAALPAKYEAVALTIGRALELALLIDHAQAGLDAGDGSTAAAALRFAAAPVDLLSDIRNEDSELLLR